MIVVAFVGWGIKDVLQNRNNFDLVLFSHADPITEDDFLKAKAEQINLIQRQNSTILTEEDIKALDIDNIILKKLINNHLLHYLTTYYDFDISNEAVIQFAKELPDFHNEHGVFDVKIFKSAFRNVAYREEQFLQNLKKNILANNVTSIFLEGFKTPRIMAKNLVDYLAESRDVDIISIDLAHLPTNLKIPSPTEDQLQDFYKKNQKLFQIDEKRKFSYIVVTQDDIKKKLVITDQDIQSFYDNHKEDFIDKPLRKVRGEIILTIEKEKIERATVDFLRNLEDSVASGISLMEISKMFGLKQDHLDYLSHKELLYSKTPVSQIATNIFELSEREVSYPIELQEKNSIIIVQMESIKPNKTEQFLESKNKLTTLWKQEYLANDNLKILENITKKYKSSNINVTEFKNIGITITPITITRAEINQYKANNFPPELLFSIFQVPTDSSTPILQFENKGFASYVRSSKTTKEKRTEIEKDFLENIKTTIRNGMMQELLSYLAKQNNLRITKTNCIP